MDKPVCQKCGGSGIIFSYKKMRDGNGKEYEFQSGVRDCDECVWKRRGRTLLERARLPPRLASASFHNYDTTQHRSQQLARIAAMKYVDEWRTMGGKGLLLTGPCGVGKSHLLVAMVRELTVNHGVCCAFVDFRTYLRDRRDEFARNRVDDETHWILGVDILMMDDLGAERPTEYTGEVVNQIINERYNRGLPIVATSNLPFEPPIAVTPYTEPENAEQAALAKERSGRPVSVMKFETLGDRVGARAFSRLEEMCNVVKVTGYDRRSKR